MCCDPKGPCYKCGLVTSVRTSSLLRHGNAFWYCADCHPEPTDLFSRPVPIHDAKSIPTEACLCGRVTQLWRANVEDRTKSWLCAHCYPGSWTNASSHVEACFDQKGPCHECGRITSIRHSDAPWESDRWYCINCHPGPARIFSERIVRSWRNAITEGSCWNCYRHTQLWRKRGGDMLCAKCFSRSMAEAGTRTA